MDRAAARRIFGIEDASGDERLKEAYWRLRAHLEIRLDADATEEMREAHRAELERLEAALVEAAGSPDLAALVRPEFEAPPRWPRQLGIAALIVALVASLLHQQLGDWLVGGRDEPIAAEPPVAQTSAEEADEPTPEVVEARVPGRLAVTANLDGAQLEIVDPETGDPVAAGAADGTFLALEPGHYQLYVEHPKCPDVWERTLDLESGERRELLAENCRDQGWLIVRSNLSDDSLEIDGQGLGTTGPREFSLAAGSHRVRVSKRGYQSWEGEVTLPAAEVITLSATLQAAPTSSQRKASEESEARAPTRPAGETAAATPQRRSAAQLRPGDEPSVEEIQLLHEWHKTARHYLLTRYDADLSGALDSTDEVESIPCDDWLGLEQSFDESGLRLPLTRFYGFDGSKWIDRALGVSAEMRSTAYERQKECGLR